MENASFEEDAVPYGDKKFQIPVVCALVLELLFGMTSCFSVVYIYWKRRHVRSVANMLITNLATVDLATCCLGIPVTIARVIDFENNQVLFCLAHEGLTSALRNASIVTLLLICFDRYESIRNPFRRRLNFTKAQKSMLLLWIFAWMTFSVPFIEHGLRSTTPVTRSCTSMFTHGGYKFRTYYFPGFLLVTIISLPCYWKISQAALSRIHIQAIVVRAAFLVKPAFQVSPEGENPAKNSRQREWRVAKMTGAIMFSVCVLWFPYMLLTFVISFLKPSLTLAKLEISFLILGYLNCTLDPLLYAFTKQKFRNAFWRTLPQFTRNGRV
ncbi:G-protein coupled receptor 22 [Nematostella vectensis]|uniref:G-protein coupled receptor 22 n=1 Tax=Nematostella vectensis TaxID=45351 RepID=UPI00207711E3|nr:G-protein coupled receptor 22 [Nematostella vectensis]